MAVQWQGTVWLAALLVLAATKAGGGEAADNLSLTDRPKTVALHNALATATIDKEPMPPGTTHLKCPF